MKVVYSDKAASQLETIRDYLAAENATLGSDIVARIFKCADTIHLWPDGGRRQGGNVRLRVVPHLPYVILYRADRRKDVLTILAVYHTAQNRPR